MQFFPAVMPIQGRLLADGLEAVILFVPCLARSLLSFSPLKAPLITLSAYPLEQRVFDSHVSESGCLYAPWQKIRKSSTLPCCYLLQA